MTRRLTLILGLVLLVSGGLSVTLLSLGSSGPCPTIPVGSGSSGNICAPIPWTAWAVLVVGVSLIIVGFLVMFRAGSTDGLSRKGPFVEVDP
jgi:hypothetical protein